MAQVPTLGRLWPRTTLWRGAVMAIALAVVAAGAYLATMPRANLALPAAAAPQAVSAPAPAVVAPASLPADPPAAVSTHGVVAGAIVSGALPVDGKPLPLPAGSWLVASADAQRMAGQDVVSAFLARFAGGEMDAAVLLTTVLPAAQAHAGTPGSAMCQTPDMMVRRVFSAVDHGAQDAWCIDAVPGAFWQNPAAPGFVQAGLSEIRHRGAEVPQTALRVVFDMADPDHVQHVEVFVAEPPSTPGFKPTIDPLRLKRLRDWAGAWHDVLRQAFDGTLKVNQVGPERVALPE